MDLDILYKRISVLGEERDNKVSSISADKNLSHAGKSVKIAEVQKEFQAKKNEILGKFNSELVENRGLNQKVLNGPQKNSFVDKLKANARRDSDIYDERISDNQARAAVVESLERLEDALNKHTFMNTVGSLDNETFNKIVGQAQEQADVRKLEMLRDVKAMRGDVTAANALNASVDVAKESHMTYEQRMAKKNLEMLDLQKTLFETTVQMVEQGQPFRDMRGGESELKIKNEIESIKSKYGNKNEK